MSQAAGVVTPDLTLPSSWIDHDGVHKTQERDDVTAAHTLKGITGMMERVEEGRRDGRRGRRREQ
jgi:hypothetical protein